MSTKNKKNITSQALLEMESLKDSILPMAKNGTEPISDKIFNASV